MSLRISIKLSTYITRHFLVGVGMVFGVFSALILLIDGLELFRKAEDQHLSSLILLQMTLLKYPLMAQKIMPFAVLIGTVLALNRLNRSQELVVIRSAGVSVWEFVLPPVAMAFLLGILMATIVNPLACIMLTRFETLESKYLHGRSSLLSLSSSGLWLRQKNEASLKHHDGSMASQEAGGETIIHSLSFGQKDVELNGVIIFVFDKSGKFVRRIDAKSARLMDDYWNLVDATVTMQGEPVKRYDEFFLETDMTLQQIHDSFASPETISFWELPIFINNLKEAGFSAIRHRVYWHSILVSPFFFVAMVLIAAVFSLSPPRFDRSALLITGSVMTGFLVYFLTNLVTSFGLSGTMPVVLSAWVPVFVFTLIPIGLLLHLEDG